MLCNLGGADMKKIICLAICLLLLCGCGNTDPVKNDDQHEIKTEVKLPFEDTIEMVFLSGAGGWGTSISLHNDGSFTGEYHDSEMGDMGDDYPDGTVYLCKFEGKFKDIEKIDDNSYSLVLDKVETEVETDKEWIEDNIRYIASVPYGIDGGKEFIFYTPQMPIEGLSEEFSSWRPGRLLSTKESQEKLLVYGLYNKNDGSGFFSQDFIE